MLAMSRHVPLLGYFHDFDRSVSFYKQYRKYAEALERNGWAYCLMGFLYVPLLN